MDIKKELKQMDLELKSAEDIVEDIYAEHRELIRQQKELTKKEHLFKVISLANKMEESVQTDFFTKKGIKWLYVECQENQYGYEVVSLLLDKSENVMHEEKQETFITNLFSKIESFDIKHANEEIENGYYHIELVTGIKDNILNLFLSNELKKLLDYNKMQIELPNNETSLKRMKI